MRLALCAAAVILLSGATIRGESLVAVSYAGPGAAPPAIALTDLGAVTRDLASIRRAGFNAILTWISWRTVQAADGPLELGAYEKLLVAASAHDLRVMVRIISDPVPAWSKGKPDARSHFTETVRSRLTNSGAIVLDASAERTLRVVPVRRGPTALAEARFAFWEMIADGSDRITFSGPGGAITTELLALGETAGVVTRNPALFATLKPRSGGVRQVSGGGGAPVQVRLLESPQALMIIAFNRSAAPRKARIAFTPEIPEAIWQDLEGGAAVNFVMERGGPALEHSFAARDVLVLMIRKTLR